MDSQELQKVKNKFDIVGNDGGLNRALETAVAIAPSDLSVLIQGENGTGKEAIPHIIHQYSRRRTGKFLTVNCGAIPSGTINSELFGHEKGSFTGAIGERKGYFEEANGGTLFLDEIGELPKETQAMLLRVLESGEYIKVGSSKVEKTDVRLIAATNVNLEYAVATGKFRQDLLYRLNAIQINLPALRDRKGDIYLLFRKFSSDFSEKYRLRKISLTHDAISLITSYRWPGNIRQLKNFAEAVTQMESLPASSEADRMELSAANIAPYMPKESDTTLPAVTGATADKGSFFPEDLQMIINAILNLKQEVDRLRGLVESGKTEAVGMAVPGVPIADYSSVPVVEPEEQFASPSDVPAPDTKTIKDMRDDTIFKTLARYDGNVKKAAAELGISDRTIYRLLAKEKGRQ